MNFYEFYKEDSDENFDKELGWWHNQGNFIKTHIIPIRFKYQITPNGKIELLDLLSGKGKNPESFDMPVLENKNIRMANIFIDHILDLLPRITEARKNLGKE